MRTLSRIQSLIQSSALLRTAIQEGSLQVVYRQPATISPDRLTVTWRLSVLILDATVADVAQGALERLGFTVQRDAEVLQAVQDFLLTAQEKAELAAEEAQAQQQAKEQQQQAQVQATATTIADLQAQIEALRDEVELLQLVKRQGRKGPQGPQGPRGGQGPAGRDGRDLVATEASLGDLQDVADTDPEQGQVLTWDQAAGQWEPKAPRTGLASIGGGGAGGGGVGTGLVHWEETEEGHLLPLLDSAQDLGSPERQLHSMHVSAQTLYIDQQPLGVNTTQQLTYQGQPLAFAADVPEQGVEEAPVDDVAYLRRNASWVSQTQVTGVPEAPLDGAWYFRSQGTWTALPNLFRTDQIIDAGNFDTGESSAVWDYDINGGLWIEDPAVPPPVPTYGQTAPPEPPSSDPNSFG